MGLFSKKQKVSVDDMAMKMMLESIKCSGKLQDFDDIGEAQFLAVSIGYFYGFLKMHLNSLTSLDTANTIINKSIFHLENAIKDRPLLQNIGVTVRVMANNSSENMQYALKNLEENPYMGLAILYLKDLYSSSTIDISKVGIAEQNMRLLYAMTSNLTKDIKIVKNRIRSNGSTFIKDYDYSEQSAPPEKAPDKPKAKPHFAPADESPREQRGDWAIYGEDIALKPVWRDENGKITCPGDACPQKCDKSCPIWLQTIAHHCAQIQEYDKAIETYKEALKIAPDFLEAQNNLGTTYGMSGQDQKAYETFLAVHKAKPRYANALQGLIIAETHLGMTKEALAHCDEFDQLPGCDSQQLREKLQPREKSNDDSYMKIASELLEIGQKEGFIPQGNSFPHVPELIMMCTETCLQLIEDFTEYGKTNPNANVSQLSLVWCAYAGIGAVYHWHYNWEELSEEGVFNTLIEERGVEEMDEYVHDCIGKPYSSKEGQQLVSHLRFMADKRLHRLASQQNLDFPHFLESAKAMFVYGMVMELHELGMH